MKNLQIRDYILIKKAPMYWSSMLSNNCPINNHIRYPIKGLIINRRFYNYWALAIQINGKIYGFSEPELLKVCKVLNQKDYVNNF